MYATPAKWLWCQSEILTNEMVEPLNKGFGRSAENVGAAVH